MTDRAPEKDQDQRRVDIARLAGSMPWLKQKDVKRYRVKLFKSGNSLAVRIPAELGLKVGTEMNMEVEDGELFSLEPIKRPKRKFDIDSIWGIESGLQPIRPGDRVFEERPSTIAGRTDGPEQET